MNAAQKLRIVAELKKSSGWELAKTDFLIPTYQVWITKLAKDRNMPERDVEFARGVVYALEYLNSLPELMEKQISGTEALKPKKPEEKTNAQS